MLDQEREGKEGKKKKQQQPQTCGIQMTVAIWVRKNPSSNKQTPALVL